jgi:hypothetical protein
MAMEEPPRPPPVRGRMAGAGVSQP